MKQQRAAAAWTNLFAIAFHGGIVALAASYGPMHAWVALAGLIFGNAVIRWRDLLAGADERAGR